jgi:hypothetical protein
LAGGAFGRKFGGRMSDSVCYDLEMKEEPSAWVHIPFQNVEESETFARILSEFAQAHEIPEMQVQVIRHFQAPQFKQPPMYYGSNVIISSICCLGSEDTYGQSRMRLRRRDFPPEDFKRLADDYIGSFTQAFNDRVQFTYEDARNET